ncbi:hypothetical protein N2152v2_009894 [Parachlorella kessleri]
MVIGPFDSVSYTVGTVTGVYKDLEDRLQAQPWWNNKEFAKAVALAVSNRFGRMNYIDGWPAEWAPFAAFAAGTDPASVDAFANWGMGVIFQAYEARILNLQDDLVWLVAKCPATCPPCTLCTGAASNYQCVKDTSISCQVSELVDDTVSAISGAIADLLRAIQAQAEQGQQPPQQAEHGQQPPQQADEQLQAKPQGSPAQGP